MKKLLLFLSILLMFPIICSASPNIKLSKDIMHDCYNVSELGCYVANTETIYLSIYNNPKHIPFLFLHEYGHYLTYNLSETKLRKLFGGEDTYKTYEKAATGFYLHILFGNLEDEEVNLFWEDLMNKK